MDSYSNSSRQNGAHHNGTSGHVEASILYGNDNGQQDLSLPPNLIGCELSLTDFASLEARWIDRPLAEAAHLRRVDSFTGVHLVGRHSGEYAGIAIPYFAPGSRHVREYRLRRDRPDLEADGNGHLKVKQKYLSPPGRGNMLYLPPGCDARLLDGPELPLIITEGNSKRWPCGGLPPGTLRCIRVFCPSA